MQFVIVSGLSGAGKSKAASDLEDFGFYCVDNMPAEMIPQFASLCLATKGRYEKVALVTDVRGSLTFDTLFRSLDRLDEMHLNYSILFIEAGTETIIKRYKETRRSHPLTKDGTPISDAIARERELLQPIRNRASAIIDTSNLSTGKLRGMLIDLVAGGIQHQNGLDEPVRNFVFQYQQTKDFVEKTEDLLDFLLPNFVDEGKSELVIAVGCTGGKHRSVCLAKEFADFITRRGYAVTLGHRDISRR